MQFTLGEMLYRFRMERNVEARQVCYGICSPATISKMENGERVPDTLMFECFMERMGISSTQFSIMVTEDESKYLEWQNQVWDVIEKEKWDELGDLLQSKVLKKTYCNKRLEEQFVYYAKGIYHAKMGSFATAAKYLKEAAEQTIPEPEGVIEEQVLLSELELSILMLYLYYGVKGEVISQPQGRHLFDILESYIYSDSLDVENKARCYPKLVSVGMHVLELTTEEQSRYLEKAIELFRKNKTFYDVTEVLHLYISLLEQTKSSKVIYYKTLYQMFCDLLETDGFPTTFKPEIVKNARGKYYVLQEYLVAKRKEMGMTQSEVSAGICEPETYSRVESGKRAPSRKNMQQLTERLGISWNYYRGEINTTDPKAFELRRRHRLAAIEGKSEEELQILEELQSILDMSCKENYQYVKTCECLTKYRLKWIDAETAYNQFAELISLTQEINNDESGLTFYSQTELELIGCMAWILGLQNRNEEGIELIVPILKRRDHSMLSIERQWNCFDFMLRVLAALYFKIGDYDNTLRIAYYVRYIKVKQREADVLTVVLDEIADTLEHIRGQRCSESEKLYRYIYYLADFFELGVKDKAKRVYEKRYGEIEWYE